MFANGGTKRTYRDLCYLSAFWRKRHRSAIVRHSRVLFQTERAAVGKPDPERGIAAGLDHVAQEHEIADVQVDGDAVARDRRGPAHRFDAPDRLLRGRRGRLGILTRRGRELDQTRGEQSAFRRNEARLLLVPELIGDENLVAVVAGQNEVRSFAVELSREQQVRVGNSNDSGIRLHEPLRFRPPRATRRGVNQDVVLAGRPNLAIARRYRRNLCQGAMHNAAAARRAPATGAPALRSAACFPRASGA
jgi:hypothetical protein